MEPGCSHYQPRRWTGDRHEVDVLGEQLAIAGIREQLPPDFVWLRDDVGPLQVKEPYALIVAGSAPHRPEKRAPAATYAALADSMLTQGITPLLVGAAKERQQLDEIALACPAAINLCERTWRRPNVSWGATLRSSRTLAAHLHGPSNQMPGRSAASAAATSAVS